MVGKWNKLTGAELASAKRERPGRATSADGARKRSVADEEARRIIRSEMQRRDVTYKELAVLLQRSARLLDIGRVTERNLISRISRGTFTFGFAVQVLRAMGVTKIDITPVSAPGVQARERGQGARRE